MMDDDIIFPDLLRSDEAPIRISKIKHIVKKRTENIHILDNRRVQKKSVQGRLRMRKYRSKSGVRGQESKKDRKRKRKTIIRRKSLLE